MLNSATSEETPFEGLVREIKSVGHWRIVARPRAYQAQALGTLGELEPFVLRRQVRMRGWYFPYLHHDEPWRVQALTTCIQGGGKFHEISECWRLYESGQFGHLDALIEDHLADPARADSNWRKLPSYLAAGGRYLEFMSALYHLTEAFAFISRLAESPAYEPGCEVMVELRGCKGRELFARDPGRHLSWRRACDEANLVYPTIRVEQSRMLTRAPDLAMDAWVWFMERFNFMSPPRDVFAEDQRKLLERRL